MNTIVWSKPSCPNCTKAKALLNKLEIQFEERSFGSGWEPEQLFEQCSAEGLPQPRTVPQIWLQGKYVGGYDQLADYIENTNFNGTGHGQ